jgi:hypothetical protein
LPPPPPVALEPPVAFPPVALEPPLADEPPLPLEPPFVDDPPLALEPPFADEPPLAPPAPPLPCGGEEEVLHPSGMAARNKKATDRRTLILDMSNSSTRVRLKYT